jgi:hypothetical protein
MEMGQRRESLGFHLVKPCDIRVLGKNHPKVWIPVFLHKFVFCLFLYAVFLLLHALHVKTIKLEAFCAFCVYILFKIKPVLNENNI